MKKLLPVFAIFLVLSCTSTKVDTMRVIKIGKLLMDIDTSKRHTPVIADVVYVGDYLIDKISLLKSKSAFYRLKVEDRDFEEPFGSNEAECVLKIETDFQNAGIRMKYNSQQDKYDILGFMTL